RLRLATRPYFIGSAPPEKTIGIVEVARLAASAAATPPEATITASSQRSARARRCASQVRAWGGRAHVGLGHASWRSPWWRHPGGVLEDDRAVGFNTAKYDLKLYLEMLTIIKGEAD